MSVMGFGSWILKKEWKAEKERGERGVGNEMRGLELAVVVNR